MPVQDQHPQYRNWYARWQRCRAFAEGEDAVKALTTQLLPKLEGQEGSDYKAYLLRAGFFGATGQTIRNHLGAAFQREPVVTSTAPQEALVEDINLDGTPLVGFAKRTVEEQLAMGRVGILCDFAGGSRQRPYLVHYTAESIINWKVERLEGTAADDDRGEELLRLVVLMEVSEKAKVDDEFDVTEQVQYRVLRLEGPPGQAIYTQQVYTRRPAGEYTAQGADEYLPGEKITPTMRGIRFTRIPFWILGAADLTPAIDKPPLLDLVNANWHHYMLSADHAHGLHWAALPTPVVTGIKGDKTPSLRVGGNTAWCLPENATFGMLEVTGAGFDAQRAELDRIEHHMEALGTRLLGDEKAGVEAEGTVAMRMSGENATRGSVINTANEGLNRALAVLSDWSATSPAIEIKITTEYADAMGGRVDVGKVIDTFKDGLIGWEELVEVFKRNGLVRPDADAEELRQRAAADVPKPAQPTKEAA